MPADAADATSQKREHPRQIRNRWEGGLAFPLGDDQEVRSTNALWIARARMCPIR